MSGVDSGGSQAHVTSTASRPAIAGSLTAGTAHRSCCATRGQQSCALGFVSGALRVGCCEQMAPRNSAIAECLGTRDSCRVAAPKDI